MAVRVEVIEDIQEALNLASHSVAGLADQLEGGLDNLMRQLLNEETSRPRLRLARVACNIIEHRFSTGSMAARVAIIAFLRRGPRAAFDFIADLEHHEN